MCLEVIIGGEILKEVALLLHDTVELVNVDLTITITVSLVDHVLEFLIVEELEHLLDILTGVLLTHLASHHGEELSKLDGAVAVVVNGGDHLLELLVLDLEAEGTHGGLELADVDGAGLVTVEEVEGLTDLVHLLIGELASFLLSSTARHV